MRRIGRHAATALALVALAGCGGEARSESSGRIEDLFKREAAKGLLRESGLPSEQAIERVARDIDVSCVRAAMDHECAVDWGEEAGERHCIVRPNPDETRLEDVRCGGAEAPQTEERYVDCSMIADVVSEPDPTGDVTENQRPIDPALAGSDRMKKVDLVAMHVAATPERLCVEWETAGPIDRESEQSFNLFTQVDSPPNGGVSLAVSFEPGQTPDIAPLGRGSISGQAGSSGRRTSLVVEVADLPEEWRVGLAERFTFSGHSAWAIRRTHPSQAYGDNLPKGPELPSYPG